MLLKPFAVQAFEAADNAILSVVKFTLIFLYIPLLLLHLGADMIPEKITFRLKREEAKQLYYQAREHGISPHQFARNIVIEGLSLARIEEDIKTLAQTMEELRELQNLIGKGVEGTRLGLIEALAILLTIQEGVTEDRARDWLKRHFDTY